MDEYLLLLLGMGSVTYLPRWIPLHYLSRRSLPKWFVQWLELIPVAILSALLLPALIIDGDDKFINLLKPELWVALPTLAFAWWTQSLGGTVVVGMLLFWMAQNMDLRWFSWVG